MYGLQQSLVFTINVAPYFDRTNFPLAHQSVTFVRLASAFLPRIHIWESKKFRRFSAGQVFHLKDINLSCADTTERDFFWAPTNPAFTIVKEEEKIYI